MWRVFGLDSDGVRALELYRMASRNLRSPAACGAALESARLAGERARDASVTYLELYRLQRRLAPQGDIDAGSGAPCTLDTSRDLSLLAAFRPAERALEAVDTSLLGQGNLAFQQPVGGGDEAGAPPRPPRIVRIDAWPGLDSARVVVLLDAPAMYRAADEVISGTATPRTFVELDGVDPGDSSREWAMTGIVTRVRAEATSTGSRLSLDLDGHAWRRVFHMREPFRIVVDVARLPPGSAARPLQEVSRIVLDAGHGGRDRGAVGPGGSVEKDVVLDLAHRAARILMAQGLDVLLTRDDDHYVSLEERTARANAFAADLFVSIHCNASEIKTRRGVETYVLDTARDEIAARVAARENETTPAANADVAAMLSGMRLADQAQRSSRFARLLERAASTTLRMRYADTPVGGVHPAGFYVLVGARMPSVLFESSYISNAVDEQHLADDEYRQLLADAIANAVKAYREGR